MSTNVMRIGHLLQRSVLRSVHSVLSVSTFNVQPRNGTSPASTVLVRSVLLHGLVFLINTFPCLLYPSLDQRQPHSYSYNITAARHISFAKMPAAAFASCEVRNSMRCLPDPSSPLLSLSKLSTPGTIFDVIIAATTAATTTTISPIQYRDPHAAPVDFYKDYLSLSHSPFLRARVLRTNDVRPGRLPFRIRPRPRSSRSPPLLSSTALLFKTPAPVSTATRAS